VERLAPARRLQKRMLNVRIDRKKEIAAMSKKANDKKTSLDRSKIKEPEEWVTGDEPMTGAQESYLHTLAREANEEVPDDLTKAEASERIEELQATTGRGQPAKSS
jgi:hypothetical protein